MTMSPRAGSHEEALAVLGVSFAAYASSMEPGACPGIGLGGPNLEVGVHQFATAYPLGVRITLCVAGRCSPTALILPTTYTSNVDGLSVADPPGPTEITITAIDAASGRTVLSLRQQVTYTRLEPYGKGCGWQYRSYHTLTATGALIDATPRTQPV